MEQNKDQSGAAVRGEAVAKCTVPPIGWRCTRIAGHEGPCAAYPIDEAAEKYEAEMLQVIDQRDKYHDMADQLAAQIAAMTEVEIGEHSSDNEPWRNALIAGDEFIAAKFKAFCNGPVSARAADALDSQPTEPDGCAECRHTYCMSGEVCRACGDVAMQGWKGGRQPTDGGVRK